MKPKRTYKMVRIPQDEYDALVRAKRELMHKGLDRLPPEVRDEEEEKGEDDEEDEDEEEGDFTLGLLVGLGAAAVIYLLTKDKQQGR